MKELGKIGFIKKEILFFNGDRVVVSIGNQIGFALCDTAPNERFILVGINPKVPEKVVYYNECISGKIKVISNTDSNYTDLTFNEW